MTFAKKTLAKFLLVIAFVSISVPFVGAYNTCTNNSDSLCVPNSKGDTSCRGSGGGIYTCDGSGAAAGGGLSSIINY